MVISGSRFENVDCHRCGATLLLLQRPMARVDLLKTLEADIVTFCIGTMVDWMPEM